MRLAPAVLALLLAVASAAQVVTVVDAASGPGSDFSSLQAAIDAAGPGAILLVRGGQYAGPGGPFVFQPVTIDGKSLVLQADEGAAVTLSHGLLVRNIPAGGSVVVRGLTVACDRKLQLQSSPGCLWLEDLTVPGSCAGTASDTYTTVNGCAQVAFNRCTLHGGDTFPFAQTTSNAVLVIDAHVTFHDCDVRGGQSNGVSPSGYGLRVDTGTVVVSGGSYRGGGVNGGAPCGGPGIWLAGGAPTAWLRDVAVTGGEGGCGQAPVQVDGGTAIAMAGPARSFTASSPVRAGGTSTVVVDGQPGDVPLLLLSVQPSQLFKTSLGGTLQLALPLLASLALPALGPGGTTSISATAPGLPAGLEGVTIFLQVACWQGPGQLVVSGGSEQVFLDGTF